jgi:hypothetical protein
MWGLWIIRQKDWNTNVPLKYYYYKRLGNNWIKSALDLRMKSALKENSEK